MRARPERLGSTNGGRHKPLLRWSSRLAEGGFALVAGALGTEIIIAEDAGGVAIVEIDLNGVIADLRGGISTRFGLIHGEQGRSGDVHRRHGFFLGTLVVASRARANVAEVREIEMAGVTVSPSDVDAGTRFDVNFDGGGLFALVQGSGHGAISNRQSLLVYSATDRLKNRGLMGRTRGTF